MKKVIILLLAVVVGGFFFEGNAQKIKKQKKQIETQKVETPPMPCLEEAESTDEYIGALGEASAPTLLFASEMAIDNAQMALYRKIGNNADDFMNTAQIVCEKYYQLVDGTYKVIVALRLYKGNTLPNHKLNENIGHDTKSYAAAQNYLVNSITDSIHRVSAVDSAQYHQLVLSVCDMIRNKVMDYSTLSQYMTAKGVNDYKNLMQNDSVYVISTDVCRFVRLGTDVQCRSVPMILTFSGGNNYTENVVFTIDENTNKIDGIYFALNERYIRSIMGDTDIDETVRMRLVTFMEKYQTAYFKKDWDFLESILMNDHFLPKDYEFIKTNKTPYFERLRNVNKEFIHLQLSDLRVEMSMTNNLFAITFVQDYHSANYGDHGYVFLLVDMADTSAEPVVRFAVFNTETTDGKIPFTMSDYDNLCGKTAK